MAKIRKIRELKLVDDLNDIIEETNPSLSENHDTDEDFIDHLLKDEPKITDQSLDRLFDEERKRLRKGFQDEVQKALSKPEMSKASLYRLKLSNPTESVFEEEIATLKSVEDIWEEAAQNVDKKANRKSIIVIRIVIIIFITLAIWATLRTIKNDTLEDPTLIAEKLAFQEKKQRILELKNELKKVSNIIDKYLSATTLSQKSESIYNAETLKSEIESYYKMNDSDIYPTKYSIESILPINLDDEKLWEVNIKKEHLTGDVLHTYYVRKNAEGAYKVDWEADVVFQRNDVEKFQETRSKESTDIKFIVETIAGMSIYNWGFSDTEYQVLRLEVPNSDKVFLGYVEIGSPEQIRLNLSIESELKNSIIKQSTKYKFILKVRFLEDSPIENDKYILIEDIVSRKWISIDK